MNIITFYLIVFAVILVIGVGVIRDLISGIRDRRRKHEIERRRKFEHFMNITNLKKEIE